MNNNWKIPLFFILLLNHVQGLSQLEFDFRLPIGQYQSSNLFSSIDFKKYEKYLLFSIPSFEFNAIYKKKYNIGFGTQYYTKQLYKPQVNTQPPEEAYRSIEHNFYYFKLGYNLAISKSTALESSVRYVCMLPSSDLTFYCKKINWWETPLDYADFSKNNYGIEIAITQKVYKGILLNLSYQYYLPNKLSRDNCLSHKLIENYQLHQLGLKFGYRFGLCDQQ